MSRAGENDLGVKEEARTQAEDLIEPICANKALADMAVNPLLLTMIATVHRRGNVLPRKRVELYKEICPQYLVIIDKFDLNLNLDLNLDLNLNLNLDLNLDLYQEIKERKASNLLVIYFPLIFVIVFYQLLTRIYENIEKNRKIQNRNNLSRQECKKRSQEYAQKKDKIYSLYVHLVLIDKRMKGNMPAWEGIRIVRTRD